MHDCKDVQFDYCLSGARAKLIKLIEIWNFPAVEVALSNVGWNKKRIDEDGDCSEVEDDWVSFIVRSAPVSEPEVVIVVVSVRRPAVEAAEAVEPTKFKDDVWRARKEPLRSAL